MFRVPGSIYAYNNYNGKDTINITKFHLHFYVVRALRNIYRVLLQVVFEHNITLRYDTGIIRVFYAHVIFKFTPPIVSTQFYGPPKYDPKPGQ